MNQLQKEYKEYHSGSKTLLQVILTVFFFSFCFSSSAAKFYFANTGSDAAAGSQVAPFQTLAKLNAVWALTTTQPGDTFALKRGDVFLGSITAGKSGTITKPIVITYYGTGADPIINGFTTASGFTNLGGNIWESAAITGGLTSCNVVLINGSIAEEGRWPNSNTANGGYATIDSHVGQTSITDASLTTDFVNGELVLRLNRFIISQNLITDVTGNTITYNAAVATDAKDGFGYFVKNHPATLDRQNEWYYNPSTKKIRVYSTTSPANVQVVTQNSLFVSNAKSYVKLIAIVFNGSNSTNINFAGGVGNYIQDCIVRNAGNEGITITSQKSFILNTQVRSSNNIGILNNYGGNYLTIQNCTIDSTGYIKGAGYGYYGSYVGLILRAKGAVVEDNAITRTGYDGIYMWNYDSILIRHNLIDTFCVNADDGAGIYTGENNTPILNYRRIIGNTIQNGIGAPEGTTDLTRPAEGVYPDVRSSGIIIQDNNISNVDKGVFIHFGHHITVTGNTFFNTPYAISIWKRAADPVNNLNINNNIVFSKIASHRPQYIDSDANDAGTYGIINNNRYAKVSTQTTMFRVDNPGSQTLSLAGFRSLTGYDLTSTQINFLSTDSVMYLTNPTGSAVAIDLQNHYWKDAANVTYSPATLPTLAPYTSKVLIRGAVYSAPVNDFPVTLNDVDTTLQDQSVNGSAISNDTISTDGGNVWSKVANPLHGSVTMTTAGNYTYTPAAGYVGSDAFTYKLCDTNSDCDTSTVTITITAVDHAPSAANDANTTGENIAVGGNVSGNDTPSADGGNVWALVGINGGALNGTVSMNTSGVYTYTPTLNYYGTDIFFYSLCDTDGDCSYATVTVTITPTVPPSPTIIKLKSNRKLRYP